ncbi:MAG: DUF2993 domain-containing protein [Cyanobacteria bacterium P01_G01_bin.49]
MQIRKTSNLISKVLSPAVQFWLRSQVDQVETLQIQIQGSNRQILGGYIPGVVLSSCRAVYQGLHLGEVQLTGENIRINIGQVLKGKPLQLLEAIRVSGEVQLTEKDLQKSLSSTLLGDGLQELLVILLEYQGIANPNHILERYQISWQETSFAESSFTLHGTLTKDEATFPLIIKANLSIIPPQTLQLSEIQITGIPELSSNLVEDLEVDLGEDVAVDTFSLETDKIVFKGELLVRP